MATLSADMRRFLLENPGAVFADFLRWYSPGNWVPPPGSERRKRSIDGGGGGGPRGSSAASAGADNPSSPSSFGTVREAVVSAVVAEVIELAMARAVAADAPRRPPAASSGVAAVSSSPSTTVGASFESSIDADSSVVVGGAVYEEGDRLDGRRREDAAVVAVAAPLILTDDVPERGGPGAGPSGGDGEIISGAASPRGSLAGGNVWDQDGGGVAAGVEEVARSTVSSPEGSANAAVAVAGSTRGALDVGGGDDDDAVPCSDACSSAISCSCRLEWGGEGRVMWREEPATHAAAAAAGERCRGVDEKEGAEWMETWGDVEEAVAAAGDAEVGRTRPLFNPAQVRAGEVGGGEVVGQDLHAVLVGRLNREGVGRRRRRRGVMISHVVVIDH